MESIYHTDAFIWKYLQGDLSSEEQEAFSNVLSQDEGLQEKLSEEIIRHYGRLTLKKRLQAIDAQVQNEFNPFAGKTFLKMAAVILLLLIPALIFRSYYFQPNDRMDLFQAAFTPYMHEDASMYVQADSSLNAKWVTAIAHYEEAQYNEAIPLFQELLAEDSSQTEVFHFYLGMSYLAQEPQQIDEAISSFLLASETDNPLKGQARWYLALAYWEKGEKEKAMDIFQQISKDTGAFNQQMASDVLSRYIH